MRVLFDLLGRLIGIASFVNIILPISLETDQILRRIFADPLRILAETDHGSEARSDPQNGYPPLLKSTRFTADLRGYPPFLADHHLIEHFSPWLPWV